MTPGWTFSMVCLVLPLVDSLGDAWLAAVSRNANLELSERLGELVRARKGHDPKIRRSASEQAMAALRAHLAGNPSDEEQLGEIARSPRAILHRRRTSIPGDSSSTTRHCRSLSLESNC